jgi:hypothetical protein
MPRIVIIILLSLCLQLASGSIDIGFSISGNGERLGTATSLDLGTDMAFHEDAWGSPEDPFIVDTCSMQGSGKANAAQTMSNNGISGTLASTLTSTGTWLAGSTDRCATILPGYLISAQKFDAIGYDFGFGAEAVSGTKSSRFSITKTACTLAGKEATFATPNALRVVFTFT